MRRREFAIAVAATALFLHHAAGSQPSRVYRLGVLSPSPDADPDGWNEFVAELSRRGYRSGHNLTIDRRFVDSTRPDLLDRAARELAAANLDVIYASEGSTVALALKRATDTVPVVFNSSGDPVGLGLVESLARPGANLTGNSVHAFEFTSKALQLLSQATGKLTSLACIGSANTTTLAWYPRWVRTMETAAASLGVRIQFVGAESASEFELTIRRLVSEGVDGIAIIGGPSALRPHLKELAAILIKYKLPSLGNPEEGFLMSYGNSGISLGRNAADYVDKILRGANPRDLPVNQASVFDLAINLKTANALGLVIPKSLLVQATQIIE